MNRVCQACGKDHLIDGFVIDDGSTYFCSQKCLHEHISQEDYEEMYEDGLAYYTIFDDEGESDE